MANRGRSGAQARAKQMLAERVAQQKVNTTNLLTPGTALSGLVGSNNSPFDGITDTLNGAPVIRVKNKSFQQMGRGVSKGGLPKSIQYAGTTLYGLKQGDDVLYRAATETPLMESFKPTVDTPDPDPDPDPDPPVGPPSPITDPRNSDYLSARKALTKDSSAADIKKVEDKGMTAWAKANPKLAAKVKPGQAGYDVIQGLEKEKDQSELLSDYKVMAGENYNEDEGKAIAGGGSVEVDIDGSGPETVRIEPKAQAFKDNAMAALLGNYGNENIKPIVEGITVPTTTDYAEAFNQTDVPDLQSMLNMGEQLGNLGYEGPSFPQSFKDRFQNIMQGK